MEKLGSISNVMEFIRVGTRVQKSLAPEAVLLPHCRAKSIGNHLESCKQSSNTIRFEV